MLNKINFEVAKIANRTYNRTIHYVRWALTGDINFKMIQNWALMTATLIHSLQVKKLISQRMFCPFSKNKQ